MRHNSHSLESFFDDLHRTWPIKRTFLFGGLVAFLTTLAALTCPLWTVILPATALAVCLLVPCLRHSRLLLLCGVAAAFWLGCMGYRVFHVLPLERLADKTDTLTGWVETCPEDNNYYTVHVTEAGLVPAGTRVLLYCPDVCAPKQYEMVTASVKLEGTSTYQSSYRAQGVFLRAFPTTYGEEGITVIGEVAPPLWQRVGLLRQSLSTTLRQLLPGDEGAVLNAICLGEKQGLTDGLKSVFRDSGLSHLLVVSGLHLSMITLTARTLLGVFRLSRRLTAALTMPVVLFFMLLIGLTPSVVRAGTMCLTWLAGQLLRRRASGLNSLGLAAVLLFVNNPYVVTSVSFLLSFFATAGVLCVTPRLTSALKGPLPEGRRVKRLLLHWWNKGAVTLATCLGATLFLLPLLCYYFGAFPLITPIANLLAVTPGTGALLCGWAGLLLGLVPGLGFLGKALLLAAGTLARLTIAAARLCSTYAGIIPVAKTWQLLLVIGACVLLCVAVVRGSRRACFRLVAGLLAISLCAGSLTTGFSRFGTTLTACADDGGLAVLYIHRGQAGLLVTDSDVLPEAFDLLEENAIDHLDYLLVGAGEPEQAGPLANLLRQTSVSRILSPTPNTWAAGLSVPITPLPADGFVTADITWVCETPSRWKLCTGDSAITLWGEGTPSARENTVNIPADGTPVTLRRRTGEWSLLPCQ